MSLAKTLVVAFCGIGDFVFSLPHLKTIKTDSPEGFDLLTFPNGIREMTAPLQLFDHISEFVQPQKWQATSKNLPLTWAEQMRCTLQIRRQKYDRIVWPFAQTTFKKRALSFLFGGRRSYLHKGRTYWSSRSLFPREKLLAYDPTSHVVERNRSLVEALQGKSVPDLQPDLHLTPEEKMRAQKWIDQHVGSKKMAGFHIGGNLKFNQARTWKPDYFATLADWMATAYQWQPVFFCSNNTAELNLVRQVRAQMKQPSSEAVGLPLRDALALIARQTFFIGNDSSLVHLAGATDVKTLVIHGPTDPLVTGAWGRDTHAVRLNLPCSPCYEADFSNSCPGRWCLSALLPELIFSVVQSILSDAPSHVVKPPKRHDLNDPLSQTIYNNRAFQLLRSSAQENYQKRTKYFSN